MTRYPFSLCCHSKSYTSGFALMEALISLSLMVIALVSSSQLYGFMQQQSQYHHQQLLAYQATENLAHRIQLNPTQWHAYAGIYTDRFASKKSCIHQVCTPAQLRHWDIQQWLIQLTDQIKLPQVQACIEAQAQKLTLIVTWLSYAYEVSSSHPSAQGVICSDRDGRKQGVQLSVMLE